MEPLDRGRNEESVVLACSALETGCRTVLPHLAEQHGIDQKHIGELSGDTAGDRSTHKVYTGLSPRVREHPNRGSRDRSQFQCERQLEGL